MALEGLLASSGISRNRIDCSIVCSSDPGRSHEWSVLARVLLGHAMLDAGRLLRPERMRMHHGEGGGSSAHRLANVVAARDRVRGACVIADFGAAVAFDAIAASGAYLGGLAIPGAEDALDVLYERAPQLPRTGLTAPHSPIGRSTAAALRSGATYGLAGQVEAIIRRLRDELGGRVKVVATGTGSTTLASSVLEKVDEVDELLTLDGLRLAAERHRSRVARRRNRTGPARAERDDQIRS